MWSSERFCFTIVSNLLPVFALLLNVNRATASLPPNYDTSVALDDWFNQVTNPTVYKKWIRPNNEFGGPLRVNISLHFYTVAILDEVTAEYSAQLLLRLKWIDPRLKTDKLVGQLTEGNDFYLSRIWLPLLHVPNNRETNSITDSKHTLFRIKTNGEVLTSKRIKLRVFCTMNLHNYPLDRQSCDFAFESSSLPSHDLEVHWCDTDPIHLTKNFQLIGFDLRNISLLEGVSQFKQTGNFSKVIVRFEVARRFGQFLLDVYIPTILFVITSWISFWIEIPAAPARVTLGMTTMLTLVTSARSAREKLPRVSYIHALDVWIVACTCFVFATLVEYAAVNHLYFKDKRCKKRRALQSTLSTASFSTLQNDSVTQMMNKCESGDSDRFPSKANRSSTLKLSCWTPPPSPPQQKPCFLLTDTSSANPSRSASIQIDGGCPLTHCTSLINTQDLANSIDRKCRVIYPFLFFVFNLIYWSVICCID